MVGGHYRGLPCVAEWLTWCGVAFLFERFAAGLPQQECHKKWIKLAQEDSSRG